MTGETGREEQVLLEKMKHENKKQREERRGGRREGGELVERGREREKERRAD